MKKLIMFVAVGAFALSMASCKKCADCQAYALGVETGEPKEFCGDELEAAEEGWNADIESGWKCD